MARHAIIAGTGIYDLPGFDPAPIQVETPFGTAAYNKCQGDLVFLPRHGLHHDTPPHAINYRANFWALHSLGVESVVAAYAVGSLHRSIPLRGLALLTDFIDLTQGRSDTFYIGGEWGVGHADMSRPYCPRLREVILARASERGVEIVPQATYACTNGPRFESPAEVRLLTSWGGDVVGMTGVPEVALARELGMHFAGVALSMNLAVGLEEELSVVRDLGAQRSAMLDIIQAALQGFRDGAGCGCVGAVDFLGATRVAIPRALPKKEA
jgi:5'-methylthioadenosine phosphorylase